MSVPHSAAHPTDQGAIPEAIALQIIACAGSGRSKVFAAASAYASYDLEHCKSLLLEAEQDFLRAHVSQTEFLQHEVVSPGSTPHILIVHAMDILISAMSEKELIEALINLLEKRARSVELKIP